MSLMRLRIRNACQSLRLRQLCTSTSKSDTTHHFLISTFNRDTFLQHLFSIPIIHQTLSLLSKPTSPLTPTLPFSHPKDLNISQYLNPFFLLHRNGYPHSSHTPILTYNPSTQQTLTLPLDPHSLTPETDTTTLSVDTHFGFDPLTKTHKVLRLKWTVAIPEPYPRVTQMMCTVLTLGCSSNGSWRKVKINPEDSGSDDDDGFVARFLFSVLRYMRRARLTLSQLLKFLCTEPIAGVYASRGIQFSRDPPTTSVSGICKFFGASEHIPMFSVDFSAVPRCFKYMYYGMFLRFDCRNFVIVNKLINMDTDSDTMTDSEEDESEEQHHIIITTDRDVSEGVPPARDSSENKSIVHEVHNTENRSILHPSVRASKLAGRTAQYRNGLNSRGIRKRRSSTRRRRSARNPLMVGMHKSGGALASFKLSV